MLLHAFGVRWGGDIIYVCRCLGGAFRCPKLSWRCLKCAESMLALRRFCIFSMWGWMLDFMYCVAAVVLNVQND